MWNIINKALELNRLLYHTTYYIEPQFKKKYNWPHFLSENPYKRYWNNLTGVFYTKKRMKKKWKPAHVFIYDNIYLLENRLQLARTLFQSHNC